MTSWLTASQHEYHRVALTRALRSSYSASVAQQQRVTLPCYEEEVCPSVGALQEAGTRWRYICCVPPPEHPFSLKHYEMCWICQSMSVWVFHDVMARSGSSRLMLIKEPLTLRNSGWQKLSCISKIFEKSGSERTSK